MSGDIHNNIKDLLDENGFLKDFSVWNEEIAQIIANMLGISILTPKHWELIYYLRNYYIKNKFPPLISTICSDTGYSLQDIYELFPKSLLLGLFKVSGLFLPGRCQ